MNKLKVMVYFSLLIIILLINFMMISTVEAYDPDAVPESQSSAGSVYSPAGTTSTPTSTPAPTSATPASATSPADSSKTIFGTDLNSWLASFYQWSIIIGGALAVLMIVWAAYEYATSAGDVEQINKAKEKIISAILGLILLVLVALILDALGGPSFSSAFTFGSSSSGGAPGGSAGGSSPSATSGWVTGQNQDTEGSENSAPSPSPHPILPSEPTLEPPEPE